MRLGCCAKGVCGGGEGVQPKGVRVGVRGGAAGVERIRKLQPQRLTLREAGVIAPAEADTVVLCVSDRDAGGRVVCCASVACGRIGPPISANTSQEASSLTLPCSSACSPDLRTLIMASSGTTSGTSFTACPIFSVGTAPPLPSPPAPAHVPSKSTSCTVQYRQVTAMCTLASTETDHHCTTLLKHKLTRASGPRALHAIPSFVSAKQPGPPTHLTPRC